MSKRYARQLHSVDDLIAAVEEYGFLPFFRNEIHGFSIEDDVDGPWEWKGPAARSGNVFTARYSTRRLDL